MIKLIIKKLLKEPQSPQTRGEVLNRDKNNMVQTFKNLNRDPYKLECKEVENYDKVMGTNYLTIFYYLALGYKQRLKKIISTIKVKSLRYQQQ